MSANTTTTLGPVWANQSGDEKCNCSAGLLLPVLEECSWGTGLRAGLYLLGLLYSFLGVSIAADVFMSAIERITSAKRRVRVRGAEEEAALELQPAEEDAKWVEVDVWNPTVANLTLMALGSSAPEILLSCIEIIGGGFTAGELGPSTIVGSAAFNLLVITAVCVAAIPKDEVRRIKSIGVFAVTAVFSVLAYVWLLFILQLNSPGVVESWEAGLTLALFLLLLVIAFLTDKSLCSRLLPLHPRFSQKLNKSAVSPVPPQTANGIHVATDERQLKDNMEKEAEEVEEGEEKGEKVVTEDEEEASEKEAKHPNAPKHDSAKGRPKTASRPRTASRGISAVSRQDSRATSLTSDHGLRYLGIGRQSAVESGEESGRGTEELALSAASPTPSQPDVRSRLDFPSLVQKVAGSFPDASAERIAQLTAQKIYAAQPHSRLYYRIRATRQLTGGAGEMGQPPELSTAAERPGSSASATSGLRRRSALPTERLSFIEFAARRYAVSESDGHVRLKVLRSGRPGRRLLFRYETLDGTAHAGKDFIAQSETLVFNPHETEKTISISLVSDSQKEPDEVFYVKLGLEDFPDGATVIGHNSVATVTITETDKETKVQFPQAALVVKENAGQLHVPVVRRGNTHSSVSVTWATADGTATDGDDFFGGTGRLVFEPGEIEKWITIPIIDDKDFEKHENFEVRLVEGSEAGTINAKKRRVVVTILNDDETTLLLCQSDRLVGRELAALGPGGRSWAEQIRQAVNVNGGDLAHATRPDYVVHVLSFGWKLLFSFVPPPHLLGGWLTFFVALAMVGLLTAVVGDLASIFGCLVGLKPAVTAITFVALGTSLPDLFASRLAAVGEPTADNSVGNVTGSNSVNVFLGLGISWLIGAVYQEGRGGEFVVAAGSLGFSVLVYTLLSLVCLGFLIVRRNSAVFGRAELGGPSGAKAASAVFLVSLWLLYVLLSVLQAYGAIPDFP